MGLRVEILRGTYDSPANAFYGKANVTVTNLPGPFVPTDDAPAAVLTFNALQHPIITPAEPPFAADRLDGRPMAGGTFAETSDSRFGSAVGFYGAVPVHDRYETYAAYKVMST